MINFRYHLVSLVAVFLALALGIVLGSGPLKEAIGDSLTGQADQLRAERDQLRVQLADEEAVAAEANGFITAVAPDLVEGTLADYRVALISLTPADPTAVAAIADQISAAGATVSAQIELTSSWTDPAKTTFRQQFAGSIAAYLDPVPPVGSSDSVDLAEGLIQALTKTDPNDPNVLRPGYDLIIELLVNGELITVTSPPTQPVDAVILIDQTAGGSGAGAVADGSGSAERSLDGAGSEAAGGAAAGDATAGGAAAADGTAVSSSPTGGATSAEEAVATGAYLAFATVSGSQVPTVLVSATTSPAVLAVRADSVGAASVTTVSNIGSMAGLVSIPLALAVEISGGAGHYGVEDDEVTAPPRIQLPAPVRVPSAPVDIVIVPSAPDEPAPDVPVEPYEEPAEPTPTEAAPASQFAYLEGTSKV